MLERYEDYIVDEEIKTIAWKNIDLCGNCGSCGGGKSKIIFGKVFDKVCGCTFRVDNPSLNDLTFLKTIVNLKINEITNN